jgi:hypothetical protein
MGRKIRWIEPFVLIFMAALILFTILPWDHVRNPNPKMFWWNLFSFGTSQGNLIAAIVYIIAAFAIIRQKKLGTWFSYLRGAAAVYMILIAFGAIYLSRYRNDLPPYFFWKNLILHQLEPLFIIVWWFIKPPRYFISVARSFLWLIPPAIFIVYTMIRGAYTSWYPYPILDVDRLGTLKVGLYIIAGGITMVIIGQLIAWISRIRVNPKALY